MDAESTLRLTRALRETARQWAETETGMASKVTEIRGVNDDPGTECYLFAFRIAVRGFGDRALSTLTVSVDHHAGQ